MGIVSQFNVHLGSRIDFFKTNKGILELREESETIDNLGRRFIFRQGGAGQTTLAFTIFTILGSWTTVCFDVGGQEYGR